MNTEHDLRTIIDERDRLIHRLREERDLLAVQNQDKEKAIRDLVGRVVALEQRCRPIRWSKLPYRWAMRVICKNPHPLGVLRQYPPRPLKLPAPHTPRPPAATPGFCILTPSYEQGRFIERTLRSVLDQSYPQLRYGVQDGGSKDQTLDILHRHADQLAYLDSRPDQGQTHAINTGFKNLNPRPDEIMAWLNSDDILLPGTLNYVAAYFANHPDIDVIYGHRIIIDEDDQEVGRWFLPEHSAETLRWVDYVPQETLFWRARAWAKVGGLDENLHFALDWSFLIKLEKAGCKIKRLPRFLGGFRVHTGQKTHLNIDSIGIKEMDALRPMQGMSLLESTKHIRNAVIRETRKSAMTFQLWRLGVKI